MSNPKQVEYSPSCEVIVSSDERKCLIELVHRHFGYNTVHDYQLTAVSAMLKGIDSSVILGTGSGKSLCYALPALASKDKSTNKKMVVVISPLIALMKDQCDTFEHAGIKTCFVNSEQKDVKLIELAKAGEMELVFSYSFVVVTQAVAVVAWGVGLSSSSISSSNLERGTESGTTITKRIRMDETELPFPVNIERGSDHLSIRLFPKSPFVKNTLAASVTRRRFLTVEGVGVDGQSFELTIELKWWRIINTNKKKPLILEFK